MAGRYIKEVFVALILFLSFILNGCFLDPNPYINATFHTPGSTWKSSDTDIWFTVNEDRTDSGEFTYNGKLLKIQTGSRGSEVAILLLEADGDKELEKIMNEKGRILIDTIIYSCSKTKLVLDVRYTNLSGFNEKQIVFTRSQ